MRSYLILVLSFLLTAFGLVKQVQAATFQWTGEVGTPDFKGYAQTGTDQYGYKLYTNNWGYRDLWYEDLRFPGEDDEVVFSSEATVGWGSVKSISNSGTLDVVSQIYVNGGTIRNAGEIKLLGSPQGDLRIKGNVTLQGGVLRGITGTENPAAIIRGGSNDTLTIAKSTSIIGGGSISANLINYGTIEAEGKELELNGSKVVNHGVIVVDEAATLGLSGYNSVHAAITGGAISGEAGSVIRGSYANVVEDIWLWGELQIDSDDGLQLRGTVRNDATLQFTESTSSQYLWFSEDTVFAGGGEFRFGGPTGGNPSEWFNSAVDSNGSRPTLTNGYGHTISGGGTYYLNIENEGMLDICADCDLWMSRDSDLVLTDTSQVTLEISGTETDAYSSITTGSFKMGGSLHVEIAADYVPQAGDRFLIIEARELLFGADEFSSGRFESLTVSPEWASSGYGLQFHLDFSAASQPQLWLTVVDSLKGDFNNDGVVGPSDLALLRDLKNSLDSSVYERLRSELTENFASQLLRPLGGSTQSIPEPTSGVLAALGVVFALRLRWSNRQIEPVSAVCTTARAHGVRW